MSHPSNLTWAEVDPTRHPFKDDAAAIAKVCLRAVPTKDGAKEGWEPGVTDLLVAKYGKWAQAWCWSNDEGTIGGGPVQAWCCAPHSYTDQAATAQRIGTALIDWRTWLHTLRGTFDTLKASDASDFTLVAPTLITLVAERTGAGDAWYNHMEQVLQWYLEHHGVATKAARRTARDAIKGQFESWSSPSTQQLEEIGGKYAAGAARQVRIAKKQ